MSGKSKNLVEWSIAILGLGFLFCALVMNGFKIVDETKNTEKKAETVFNLTVDYDRPLDEMIVAGHYRYSSRDITENTFPPEAWEKGRKDLTFKIFVCRRPDLRPGEVFFERAQVFGEMKLAGYRPATIRELLAFGNTNAETAKEWTGLVALGSRFSPKDRRECSPTIVHWANSESWSLDLHLQDDIRLEGSRCLAVKKATG